MGIWGEQPAGKQVMRSLFSFPMLYPRCLFHLAVPEFYPFTINWKSNKNKVSLSSSSTFSKLIEPKEIIGRIIWTHWPLSEVEGRVVGLNL